MNVFKSKQINNKYSLFCVVLVFGIVLGSYFSYNIIEKSPIIPNTNIVGQIVDGTTITQRFRCENGYIPCCTLVDHSTSNIDADV